MLNRRFLVLAAGSLLVATSAQAWSLGTWGNETVKGSGEITSEIRNVGQFDAISLAGDFAVTVRQTNSPRVEVRTDRNLQALLETQVIEGRSGRYLSIRARKGINLAGSSRPQLVVDLPVLSSIEMGGSGLMRIEAFKTPSVSVTLGGSGDIVFDHLESDTLSVGLGGSGTVKASGKVNTLRASVAGSGDFKARELVAAEASLSVTGSGDVEVQATKTLRASIAGSGDVGYVGAPELSVSVAGSGRVRKLN
ncbi:head GIN domain-containing protein [Roseateles koreensis]|uniref:DUF2807 domain-containing protein n=1 Tax=Roseateles koreensis TaxID=2987526 RepID=A0ABT5KP20_9BURK|nr:head GIN domain-containing protein [Roseateles koreensis]MDC8784591.1 DUF2807 domain-containing protein [Roseateles koreensis]